MKKLSHYNLAFIKGVYVMHILMIEDTEAVCETMEMFFETKVEGKLTTMVKKVLMHS